MLVPVAEESSRRVRWSSSIGIGTYYWHGEQGKHAQAATTKSFWDSWNILLQLIISVLKISYYLYCRNRLSGAPLFLYSMCSTDKVLRFNELEVRALNTKPSVLWYGFYYENGRSEDVFFLYYFVRTTWYHTFFFDIHSHIAHLSHPYKMITVISLSARFFNG